MIKKIMWLCYEFTIHHPDTIFEGIGGVYMFCGINEANEWVPLYVGQAPSLAGILDDNDIWLEAEELGATHVLVRTSIVPEHRDQVERRLIDAYQPFLNAQQLMRA